MGFDQSFFFFFKAVAGKPVVSVKDLCSRVLTFCFSVVGIIIVLTSGLVIVLCRCGVDGCQLVHGEMMRRHWLLVGACGWVLLLLMVASRFINFNLRVPDGE